MMSILADRQLSGFGFTEVLRMSEGRQCVLMYTKSFLFAIESRAKDRYGEARGPGKVDEELATSCLHSDGVLSVMAGADNQVSRIEFNDVREVFDAKGVTPAEFVKRLAAEYHIPELTPNAERTAWSYASSGGANLEVVAKEVLGIPMVRIYLSKAAAQ
jgi:hypothetical protein